MLPEVRAILREHTALERASQGDGDTLVMKLCCVQLFFAGHLEDVMTIWAAKQASFDAASSIDVQMLCGAGLEATKKYLAAVDGGQPALEWIFKSETSGDDFDVETTRAHWRRYYGVNP